MTRTPWMFVVGPIGDDYQHFSTHWAASDAGLGVSGDRFGFGVGGLFTGDGRHTYAHRVAGEISVPIEKMAQRPALWAHLRKRFALDVVVNAYGVWFWVDGHDLIVPRVDGTVVLRRWF